MEIVTSPTSIFPLRYPQGDPSLPNGGAKAIPVNITMGADDWTVNLTILRQQKGFGSLRCIWIDTLDMTAPLLVCVDGTTQRFEVPAGTTGYYPVVVVNDPVVKFILNPYTSGSNYLRAVFLNFIPVVNPPLGNVGVNNFPSVQPISGSVGVNNFPLIQPVENATLISMVSPVILTGTPFTISGLKGINVLRFIKIDFYEVQTALNNIAFYDGAGRLIFEIIVAPLTSSFTQGGFMYSDTFALRMNNVNGGLTVALQQNLLSGNIAMTLGY